jgi:hypothetical protein
MLKDGGPVEQSYDEKDLLSGIVAEPFTMGVYIWVCTGLSRKGGRYIRAWARKLVPEPAWAGVPPRTPEAALAASTGDEPPDMTGMVVTYDRMTWVLDRQVMLVPSTLRAPDPPPETKPVKQAYVKPAVKQEALF